MISEAEVKRHVPLWFLLKTNLSHTADLRRVEYINFPSSKSCILSKESFGKLLNRHEKISAHVPYLVALIYDRMKLRSEVVCDGRLAYQQLLTKYEHPTTAAEDCRVRFFQYHRIFDSKAEFIAIRECRSRDELESSGRILDIYNPVVTTSPMPLLRALFVMEKVNFLFSWIDVYLNRAVTKDNIEDFLEISEKLVQCKKMSQSGLKAERLLKKLLEFDPTNFRASHALAMLYHRGADGVAADLIQADVFYKKAVCSIDEDLFLLFKWFGLILLKGKIKDVKEKVEEKLADSCIDEAKKSQVKLAFAMWSSYSSLLFTFGLFQKERGHAKKAKLLFENAIQANPMDFYSRVHLAELLYASAHGKDDKMILQSIEHLKQAIYYGTDLGDPTKILASAYLLLGKICHLSKLDLEQGYIKAIDYFEEAINTDPGNPAIVESVVASYSEQSAVILGLHLPQVTEKLKKLMELCSPNPAAVNLFKQLS